MTIRAIIADDHTIIREGLKGLLENKGVDVAAIAKNGREAVELAAEHKPDVVIMDISMPDFNGLDATAIIRDKVPGTRIIALSMHSGKNHIDKMFASGASGYVLKDSAMDELYDAIQAVHNGHFYLSGALARMYMDSQAEMFKNLNLLSPSKEISKKERHVLQLVAEGKKTKDIAQKMGISIKTVETHRSNLMKKLGIFSIAGLTKFAIKEGMVALD